MAVEASFGRTWDSVIDVFAERNVLIRTLDRASGFVVAETQSVNAEDAVEFADCGTDAMRNPRIASNATWNLLVRGDSTRSTVKASVRFVRLYSTRGALSPIQDATQECSSLGIWETQVEDAVKARAEGKR